MTERRLVYAIVPVKDPALGKSRLAPLLDAQSRRALCLGLARRTLAVCERAFGADRTIVVTAAPDIASLAKRSGMHFVSETGTRGLNGAIRLGAKRALAEGADSMLVVPADLALASVEDFLLAAEAIPPAPGCLVVPDRRGSGTNLLGLSPVRDDLFAFGPGSLQLHEQFAARAGCEVRVLRNESLALDLDLPEDYEAWRLSASRPEASAPEALLL